MKDDRQSCERGKELSFENETSSKTRWEGREVMVRGETDERAAQPAFDELVLYSHSSHRGSSKQAGRAEQQHVRRRLPS
jgi:hypothetical protein